MDVTSSRIPWHDYSVATCIWDIRESFPFIPSFPLDLLFTGRGYYDRMAQAKSGGHTSALFQTPLDQYVRF